MFGREAGLFVPSGSMGNLASVMSHTRPGEEVICETNGHIYNYEMGALSAIAGVLPRIVNGEDGLLSWDAIAFGGGMRQAGVLAAAGLIALEQGPKRLQDDHDAARALAQRLARIQGIALDAAKVQTNIVIFSVKPSGLSSAEFLSRLAAQNVLAVPVDADRVRMVTHLDVSRGDIEAAADATERVLQFTSSTLYKEPASD